jgi:hypothetical protein
MSGAAKVEKLVAEQNLPFCMEKCLLAPIQSVGFIARARGL